MTEGCAVPGCVKGGRLKRGWCEAHYWRWRKHGDPLGFTQPHAKNFFNDTVLNYDGKECLIWPYTRTRNGYGTIKHAGRVQVVSRLLCEMVNGPPPDPSWEAAHSCGKGHLGCVAQHHLSWKTRTDNQADRAIHGTTNRGKHYNLAQPGRWPKTANEVS